MEKDTDEKGPTGNEESEKDFIESFLKMLGIDVDGISEKIEALEKAKKDKDPKAYLAALHSLLDQAGDSTIPDFVAF